ncbi:MAG: hypothetical protein GY866_23225 [Proteobacteria bacterium]|nr:hypothetical protein [Pseudomonadota bacterium]
MNVPKTDITEITNRFKRVGSAIARVNANNTHSGNISMLDPNDPDVFYITSSGSQSGALIPRDIVPVRFSRVSWGDARGSTESTIHRRILALPDAMAGLHAHALNSTYISFDTRDKELFLCYTGLDDKNREEYLFVPVDLFGAFAVGQVNVAGYFQPVGSEEMDERIPKYLKNSKVTVVKGHGPFIKASSVEQTLYYMNVFEHSAKLAIYLRRRGLCLVEIEKEIMKRGVSSFFPVQPHILEDAETVVCDVRDQSVIDDFKERLNYNFNNLIGAYGTGSMSQKISTSEMIYCPMSAIPEGFDFPLVKTSIEIDDDDTLDMKLHKGIYRHTHQNTCMITTSPLATAEGMAILAERFGTDVLLNKRIDIPYTPDDHPSIAPIDAEAIYLNPRLGLVDIWQLTDETSENPIFDMLRWYKGCCVVSGYGVVSTGDTTLEQAAHNASSAERIAAFRSEVFINHKLLGGEPVQTFEPE